MDILAKESPFTSSPLPVRPGLRRDKPQLACTSCRARKVKCDRNHPCQNCTRRGQEESCTFLNPMTRKGVPKSSTLEARSMRQRVTQLEGLLRSFVEPSGDVVLSRNHSETAYPLGLDHVVKSFSPLDSTTKPQRDLDMNDEDAALDERSPSPGQLTLGDTETSYVGSAHWGAILNEVVSLKDLLSTHDSPDSYNGSSSPNGLDLFFPPQHRVTQAEILTLIPPKDVADRLISRYFSIMDMALLIVHVPTFQKEYEQFWLNPWGTSVMWLSVLFGMMCLAEQFSSVVGDEAAGNPHKPQNMMQKYREKVVQCLVSGNYTKPIDYILEALLQFYAIEQYRGTGEDDHFGISILVGIMVRTAMRMGYHRDPSHYPKISAFHGEMRRRIWSQIVTADILTASQVGLPKLINESQTDTKPPCNLLDEDFDEQTVELPSPRSSNENVLMSYAIIKYRLMLVFGKIGDQSTSTQAVSFTDDVMKLDKLLHDTYSSIPPPLQMRPTASFVIDSSAQILRRFTLEVLFQKSRCVLHRRYLVLARSDQRYLYSRQSCIDAAMELLRHQSFVHRECQPGGLLQRESWKLAPLMVQDFLLAAMIICLEFDHLKSRSQDIAGTQDEVGMLQALRKSYGIWRGSAASSTEALKASTVLKMILEKVSPTVEKEQSTDLMSKSTEISPWPTSGTDRTGSSSLPNDLGETYDYLNDSFLDQQDGTNQIMEDPFAFPNVEVIENMICQPGDIDWTIWDTCT